MCVGVLCVFDIPALTQQKILACLMHFNIYVYVYICIYVYAYIARGVAKQGGGGGEPHASQGTPSTVAGVPDQIAARDSSLSGVAATGCT